MTNKNNDTISRQAAIDAAKRVLGDHEITRTLQTALYILPSAQSEQEKGKWIVYYECPKCGEITKDFTEYCPFCNADMRGEEDE